MLSIRHLSEWTADNKNKAEAASDYRPTLQSGETNIARSYSKASNRGREQPEDLNLICNLKEVIYIQ